MTTLVSLATFLLSLQTPDGGSCDYQAAGSISEVRVSALCELLSHDRDQTLEKSNVRRKVHPGSQLEGAVSPV